MNTVPISTNWGFVKEPGKTPIEKILPNSFLQTKSPAPTGGRFEKENGFSPIAEKRLYLKTAGEAPNLICTDVAGHLTDCPVCSYLQGKQKLLYICLGAIIVIIFFLIKKTL